MWILAQSSDVPIYPEDVIGLVAVSGFFITFISIFFIMTISNAITKIRTTRMKTDLVNNLANRGYSADEIQSVLIASSETNLKNVQTNPNTHHYPTQSQPSKSVPPQKPIVHTG